MDRTRLILIPHLADKESIHHHSCESRIDHQWRRNKVQPVEKVTGLRLSGAHGRPLEPQIKPA